MEKTLKTNYLDTLTQSKTLNIVPAAQRSYYIWLKSIQGIAWAK